MIKLNSNDVELFSNIKTPILFRPKIRGSSAPHLQNKEKKRQKLNKEGKTKKTRLAL